MLEIYLQGALEPVRADEGWMVTTTNLNSALNNNLHFFGVQNPAGENEALRIEHIYRIREVGESE